MDPSLGLARARRTRALLVTPTRPGPTTPRRRSRRVAICPAPASSRRTSARQPRPPPPRPNHAPRVRSWTTSRTSGSSRTRTKESTRIPRLEPFCWQQRRGAYTRRWLDSPRTTPTGPSPAAARDASRCFTRSSWSSPISRRRRTPSTLTRSLRWSTAWCSTCRRRGRWR